MKTKAMNIYNILGLSAVLVAGQTLVASENLDFTKALAGTPILEVPAKAASLITAASAADRQFVAETVVEAAVGLQPSESVAIVGAVSRANQSSAPIASVVAAKLQHQQLHSIVKAATSAAPGEAGQIVSALIREFPADYGVIAIAAAEAAPAEGKAILSVVAESVPALQVSINGAVATFANDKTLPVQAILTQSYNRALTSGTVNVRPMYLEASMSSDSTLLSDQTVVGTAYSPTATSSPVVDATTSGSAGSPNASITPVVTLQPVTTGSTVAPPTIGPPYVPLPGTIIGIGPAQTIPQTPGGRNYSSP
jgi:hypothetical protein